MCWRSNFRHRAQPQAFSAIMPGLGFLRDVCTTPFLVHWQISDGWATSPQLPGVRIPGPPLWASRPWRRPLSSYGMDGTGTALHQRGGFVFPPDVPAPCPATGRGHGGLRTLPPVKTVAFRCQAAHQRRRLLLPMVVEGALFSVGDGHFAQGDGEVCVTAVEMGATVAVRFRVLKRRRPCVPCGRRVSPTTVIRPAPMGRSKTLRGHHGIAPS